MATLWKIFLIVYLEKWKASLIPVSIADYALSLP